jgi:hypothetical protein
MPYYEQEPQPVLETSKHKPYLERKIANDRTVHNNNPDRVMFDKTIREAHLILIAISDSHNLQNTSTGKFRNK